MIIELYKNNSDNNVVNKKLTNVGQINVRLKEPVEREAPQLLVSGQVDDSYDYFYIPEWNRYYYVEGKRQFSESIYQVYGKIDVLKSFRSKILRADALVEVSENFTNNYLPSNIWQADVRDTTSVINFKNPTHAFTENPTYVLITAGATI